MLSDRINKILFATLYVCVALLFLVVAPTHVRGSDNCAKNGKESYIDDIIFLPSSPVITLAYVEPSKVISGDLMTIVVEVEDSNGVASVKAEMEHELGSDIVELQLVDGNENEGLWKGIWLVHDTKVRTYITTITATSALGKSSKRELEWEDPPWLNTTLIYPNSTYQDPSNPLEVSQYNTFVVNASVECIEESCGNVYGSVRYNSSGATPNELMSVVSGETPFYIPNKTRASNSITLGSGVTNRPVGIVFQRQNFYAENRFWVFWSNGTAIVYSTSIDGSSWDTNYLRSGTGDYGEFSLWYNESHVHYAWTNETVGSTSGIKYRVGVPNSDGSITWNAAEQTAVSTSNECGGGPCRYLDPMVAVDSAGYPWVGYWTYGRDLEASGAYSPYVTKSSTNNGIWTTESGFPYKLSTGWYSWRVSLVPLTEQKMYAFYGGGYCLRGNIWNGTDWEGAETIDGTCSSGSNNWRKHSAIGIGDDVHVVYMDRTPDILYKKRTYGVGWSSSDTIDSGAIMDPLISFDSTNNISYFIIVNKPNLGDVSYKRNIIGSWESSLTNLTYGGNSLVNGSLSASYRSYGSVIGISFANVSEINETKFTFIDLRLNPLPCGSLSSGQSCQLNWTVNVTGNAGHVYSIDVNFSSSLVSENNTADAYVKIKDNETSTFSNNMTELVGIYTSSGYSNFSVTWDDNSGSLHDAYLEHNFTGSLNNESMDGSYPNYYYNSSPLKAGVYQFRFVANDSSGNDNATVVEYFNIEKGDVNIDMWLNGTKNNDGAVGYPSDMNATCKINISSQNSFVMEKNGSIVGSQNGQVIEHNNNSDVTVWNFTCYYDQTENYSAFSRTHYMSVNAATPSLTLTLDGDSSSSQSRIYPNNTHFVLSESNNGDGGCVYNISENGVDQGIDYSKMLAAGVYNITGYTDGCANYSGNQVEIVLTVYELVLSIDLNVTEVNYGDGINVSGRAYYGEFIPITNSNITVSILNQTKCEDKTNSNGYYDCQFNAPMCIGAYTVSAEVVDESSGKSATNSAQLEVKIFYGEKKISERAAANVGCYEVPAFVQNTDGSIVKGRVRICVWK